ncbi:MAG TPA: hypothetical protein VNB64_14025 [Solirubrobacteraceae bacterium]|nr:hypothetical protein [Solirubrobacteraceae bacterium]
MRLAVLGAAVVAFLALSAVVARVIGAGSAARADAIEAVKRQAAPGRFRVLNVDGVGGFAPAGRTETARVAWKAGERLPVVQCVRVRRSGDPLSGYDVDVLRVSPPIGREADCPR